MNANTRDTNDDYWKFAESERHFNETQAGIRNLASGWMLAAFAAIALLLKTNNGVTWLVSPAVLVAVISFMATLGLLILWINDQLVYQRLLDCGFITAVKMEYDNPSLPPVRLMMMYSVESKGMSRWMTYFYTIPMWSFLAISIGTTLLRESIDGSTGKLDEKNSLSVLITLCVAQLCATLWVQWKKQDVGAKARAALFGEAKFAALFEDSVQARERLAEVIARHKPAVATEGGTVK